MEKHTIIAVDGPAASGKGTLARALAETLGFAYLDTGALYRCVGKAVLDAGGDPSDEKTAVEAARKLSQTLEAKDTLDPALRTDKAGQAASKVAFFPDVRAALMDFQRSYAHKIQSKQGPYGSGVILDGRDIGTVIAPDATVKFFVIASLDVRAERRFKELTSKGIETTYEAVFDDMEKRDARDTNRDVAPLKPADDAHILDTSSMTADEAFAKAISIIRQIIR